MLNESEEERLLFLLQTDQTKVAKGMIVNPTAYAMTYLWLAEKLKETNDELKGVYEEIALHARAHPEAYKDSKIKKEHLSECYLSMFPQDKDAKCTCGDWSPE